MASPTNPIRLHRFPLSGHSHRAELFLSLLQLPFVPIDVDLASGAHKAPDFLAKNPFGQVPVIEDGEVTLSDSNAILVYLASRYDTTGRWLPHDPLPGARVQQWLAVAAGPLAYGPAAARLVTVFGAKLDHERAKTIAAQLYNVVDSHLAERQFLVGNTPTIADIALYSYTAHAPEGGVSLDAYHHIRTWLARIEALPHFVPMQRTQTQAVA
jgi:glutathione S-transferase